MKPTEQIAASQMARLEFDEITEAGRSGLLDRERVQSMGDGWVESEWYPEKDYFEE